MILDGMLARRMFLPEAGYSRTPAAAGLEAEEVAFEAADGVPLYGWFLPGEGHPWLWSHGNGGNISHRLGHASVLHAELGVPLFLYDYRGYGRSSGSPSERGTYSDARGALRWLASRCECPTSEVIVYGQSLGSAVAVDLAMSVPVRALVVEAGFTSVSAMVRRSAFWPLSPLFSGIYDTASKIGRVAAPLLILHGSVDETVPVAMGRELFEAASPPKTFRIVPGARHDDIFIAGGAAYVGILRDFLDGLETAVAAGAEG